MSGLLQCSRSCWILGKYSCSRESQLHCYRAQSSAGALGNVVKWILMEVSYNQKFRTCAILASGRKNGYNIYSSILRALLLCVSGMRDCWNFSTLSMMRVPRAGEGRWQSNITWNGKEIIYLNVLSFWEMCWRMISLMFATTTRGLRRVPVV